MPTFGTNRFDYPQPAPLIASCRAAEAAGFRTFWFPDSQLKNGDVFINVLTALQHTSERISAGPLLVNPVTRHPSVTAASIAAVDLYAPGRVLLGVGSGDTAVWQIGKRPARLREMERAVTMMRTLLAGGEEPLGWTQPTRFQPVLHRRVPVIIAGSGPKTLRMAGRVADGVVIRIGTDSDLVQWGYEQVCAGAREAGRDPATLWLAGHFHTVIADDPDLAAARGKVMAAGYYEVNPGTWERLGIAWPCPPVHDLLQQVRPDFHHALDMDLAARLVAEIPVDVARRFCLMGNGREVRAQVEAMVGRFPWMQHIILQPNMPGPAFLDACAREVIPAFAGMPEGEMVFGRGGAG